MADNDSTKTRGDLMLKLDELMESVGDKYGPFMLEELTQRLEKTIDQFHQDVTILFEETFNRSKKIQNAVKTALSTGNTPDLSNISSSKSTVPQFMSDKKDKDSNSGDDVTDKEPKKKKKKFFTRKK